MKRILPRRLFLQRSVTVGVGLATIPNFMFGSNSLYTGMKLGLATYQWGKDWDLPTLIANCEKAGLSGVELRTQHAMVSKLILMQRNVPRLKSVLPTAL